MTARFEDLLGARVVAEAEVIVRNAQDRILTDAANYVPNRWVKSNRRTLFAAMGKVAILDHAIEARIGGAA